MVSTPLQANAPRRVLLSYHQAVAIILSIFFVLGAQVLDLRVFTGDPTDGFFSQIQFIALTFAGRQPNGFFDPLLYVHVGRYFIIYPWFHSWLNNWPASIDALFFLPLLLSVALAKFKGRSHPIQLLIFLIPFALSYRTVFVIVGIANLYIFLFSSNRNPLNFYLSALMTILSSGVALAWFIIVTVLFKRFKTLSWGYLLAIFAVGASLVAVTSNKLGYFSGPQLNYTKGSGLTAAIERNTILVSYAVGDSSRFLLYVFILSAVVWFLHALNKLGKPGRPLVIFFVAAASAFLFEGLGAIAFIMPVLWALTGQAELDSASGQTEQTA